MTVIPPNSLAPETLRAVIEEFITRQGAVHGHADPDLESQIAGVLRQLKSGDVVLVFDEESESCTLLPARELPPDARYMA